MTDEQITKALECCIHKDGIINCEPCPVGEEFGYQMCEHILILQCNGLINRQKAEIERLRKSNEEMFVTISKQDAENERLQHYKQSYDELKAEHLELIRSIKTCQIEAIKEFERKSEDKLIEIYEKYHQIANNTQLKEGVDMFYQGRAEAIWECIDVNRATIKEMVGDSDA